MTRSIGYSDIDCLDGAFRTAAEPPSTTPSAEQAKAPSSVISLRVTAEERAKLEREAAGLSLSAYLRDRLLNGVATPRRTRGKFPVKDHEALARVLGRLGRSHLYTDLQRLLLAVEEGRVPLEKDMEAELRTACAEITAMRRDLVTALGLKSR